MRYADVVDRGRLRVFRWIGRFVRVRSTRESDTIANVRTATATMLIAFALFAVFASHGMCRVARDLPGNAVSDMLVAAADGWDALMQQLGPARLRPAVREALEAVRNVRW